MTDDHLNLIKSIGTFCSIAFGLLTWLRNRKMVRDFNASLWLLFKKQQNNYGISQAVLCLYKQKHHSNIDIEVLEWASKAESYNQNIFEDIMKQIHQSDKKLTLEKVNAYCEENKISHYDKNLFEMMINEPKDLNLYQKVCKFFGIPI